MIRYRLRCHRRHEFEAWFRTSAAYDRQVERGEVKCPECASPEVSKTLMAPNVARRTTAKGTADVPVANGETARQRQMLALMRKLRREIERNADYVGPRVAEEARKIHYEEVAPRGIYGEATQEDFTDLREEGIECYPLPRLPEDRN